MGRPSKRTPEVEERILAALRKGLPKKQAAARGGIHYDTLREWEKAFPEFAEATEKAGDEGAAHLFEEIVGDPSWQAKAWALERTRPSEFGRRERVEMTGADGGPIESRDVSALPDHERDALAAAIRGHLRGEEEPTGSPAGTGEG